MKIPRRDFLKLSAASGIALFLQSRQRFMKTVFAAVAQTPLPGSAIPQFLDPVPDLLDANSLIVDTGVPIELEMREQLVNILPAGTVLTPGYTGTYVWSYLKPGQASRTSYLGPAIVATRGTPTKMIFHNLLADTATSQILAYKNSTD